MTLPAVGQQISMSQVNTELLVAATTQISLNDTAVRGIAGKTTAGSAIAMSDLSGKSARVAIASAATISSNQTNYTINVSGLAGYIAGKSDITITVNSGIYVYSTSTGTPGLTITGATTGDNINLVNNGYIIGMGGQGGTGDTVTPTNPGGGGPALSLGCSITITNNGYIAGGGGGGGPGGYQLAGGCGIAVAGGGGGAGGGAGGMSMGQAGGAGGAPGAAGASTSGSKAGGGGGGRVLPGTGGLVTAGGGAGGGAGKSVLMDVCAARPAGAVGGGGGGGWGAGGSIAVSYFAPVGASDTGGSAGNPSGSGAASSGGAAILRNGYTVTWAASGTVYGTY